LAPSPEVCLHVIASVQFKRGHAGAFVDKLTGRKLDFTGRGGHPGKYLLKLKG
jgi:hypothetical protein